jgi:hypothetical protein
MIDKNSANLLNMGAKDYMSTRRHPMFQKNSGGECTPIWLLHG